MNAEIYKPLWANTAPSILKSNYKTSNLSHKQQKLSSLGFLTILRTHHSLQPGCSSLQHSLWHPRPGRRTGVHPGVCRAQSPQPTQPRGLGHNPVTPGQRNNISTSPASFLQQSHAWQCQPKLFICQFSSWWAQGRQKLESNQSPPWNHSVMEPGRQLVATPSKQPLHNENKGGFF